MSSKSGIALTPLAAAVSAALAPAGSVQAQEDGSSVALEEIIVTARKREENLQEIPLSIQAIPQSVLEKMGAKGLEDYTRFIPSVNVISYYPGSADIIFRGVHAGGNGIGQSPATMYFDELAMTTTGSQPEVRMYDINRVEALDGPQGTLYGGSAQSGTLRIITNQPDPSQFEAIVDITLKQGENTSLSNDVSGVLNLPFGDGQGALRLVGFTATDAGYIDNVFGHTPDTHAWYNLPATWGVEDNAEVVEDDWNELVYQGGRASLRWEFNDEWAATVSYMYQKSEGNGGNHYDPFVGDLKVVKFNDEYRDDQWDNMSLTLEGDLGWAQLVSATSYFDRTSEEVTDSTVYTKYYQSWACLYQWNPAVYTGYFVDPSTGYALYYPRYCFGPSSLSDTLVEQQFNGWSDKFSQEIRLSGGNDSVDWIVGLYYEKTNDDWISPWGRVTNSSYQDSVAYAYWQTIWGPGFAPNATAGWVSNSQVDWEQKAVFGEFTWRINDQWSTVIGGRAFDREMKSVYFVENPETQLNGEFVTDGIARSTGGTSDFVPKVTLSFQPTDDATIYALYSEGFRPGGTNRGRGNPILPNVFDADKLKNTELGIKTLWANGRVRANLTYYDMQWDDFQLSVVDPSFLDGEPWQVVIANVGNAAVTGIQAELDIAVTEYMNFGVNASSIDAEVTSDINLDADATTIEIPSGTRLPNSPEFKASGWLDFSWNTSFIPGSAFARLQVSHTGSSLNQIRPRQLGSSANPQIKTPSYTIADFRVGIVTESNWQVDLFVSNLTDERAQYTEASGLFEIPFSSVQDGRSGVSRIYTNRPREYGVRVSYRWGE